MWETIYDVPVHKGMKWFWDCCHWHERLAASTIWSSTWSWLQYCMTKSTLPPTCCQCMSSSFAGYAVVVPLLTWNDHVPLMASNVHSQLFKYLLLTFVTAYLTLCFHGHVQCIWDKNNEVWANLWFELTVCLHVFTADTYDNCIHSLISPSLPGFLCTSSTDLTSCSFDDNKPLHCPLPATAQLDTITITASLCSGP